MTHPNGGLDDETELNDQIEQGSSEAGVHEEEQSDNDEVIDETLLEEGSECLTVTTKKASNQVPSGLPFNKSHQTQPIQEKCVQSKISKKSSTQIVGTEKQQLPPSTENKKSTQEGKSSEASLRQTQPPKKRAYNKRASPTPRDPAPPAAA